VFIVGRPDLGQLDRILTAQASEALTYDAVGATRGAMPAGFRHDRHVAVLGGGNRVFGRAVEGLQRWEAHRGAGLILHPAAPPIREGTTVVQMIALPGVSAVAACRSSTSSTPPTASGSPTGRSPLIPSRAKRRSS
jgi:uncharacterized protein (UPF0548 family)